MGQKVLAYQFVSGLLLELKVKVAGAEGTFDQLWIRAQFEEAKLKRVNPTISSCEHWWRECQQCWIRQFRCNNTSQKCYICGQVGHIQRNCPQQHRGKPVEARGPPSWHVRWAKLDNGQPCG